ncbi:MAG: hypothetical protein RR365_00810 [Bacteroides sp.]
MSEWIAFYAPGGKELGAYTLRGTFAGELQATKELLASENGLKPEKITAKLENRKEKSHDRESSRKDDQSHEAKL